MGARREAFKWAKRRIEELRVGERLNRERHELSALQWFVDAIAAFETKTERPGICRWCGCDHHHPCESGCGWANSTQTLCTACINFDRSMRSKAGRAEAVRLFNIGEDAQ